MWHGIPKREHIALPSLYLTHMGSREGSLLIEEMVSAWPHMPSSQKGEEERTVLEHGASSQDIHSPTYPKLSPSCWSGSQVLALLLSFKAQRPDWTRRSQNSGASDSQKILPDRQRTRDQDSSAQSQRDGFLKLIKIRLLRTNTRLQA